MTKAKESRNPWRPPRGKTPREVGHIFMDNNGIGDQEGVSLKAAREQGLIPDIPSEQSQPENENAMTDPDTTVDELGESALNIVKLQEQYPDEIEIQAPSAATLKHWGEITEYKTTSDGQTWLCAVGEDGEIFAATKATSDNPANNQRILFTAASDILYSNRNKVA
jgi:hypothetical protein